MTFAYAAAVAGVGTVSSTGTTTLTGVGTTFATLTGAIPGANHARVGGTITVGANTRTIVAIQSTTSLTTDTAFPVFTGQAFTVQTAVTQTGTDTMNLALGAATGFLISNRADLYRTFDVRGLDLTINGTLTVDSTVAQLRNDGSCNNRFLVNGSATGGEIIVNGQKASAGNGLYPYVGFDWLGTNGLFATVLASTNASFPAKFTLIDACVRFGADWLTVSASNFARITTQGDECWILCAKGTGTSQGRVRLNNTTAVLDLQAKQTWIGVWLNFGVPQLSLKGFTPISTDGPELNLSSVAVATRIIIEDYDTRYIQAAYYPGVQLIPFGGAWVRLKNNLFGTNIAWRSGNGAASTRNVLEFSKQITITAQDATGNLLSNGFMYYQPVGSNVAGIRAKGGTVDITFDLTQQAIATASGTATSEFVYAWDWSIVTGTESTYEYFCTGTTKGAESHTFFSSRYGYDKQSTSVLLAGNGAATPIFTHTSLLTTDKVIANAAALSGVTFNFTTKTMTVTANNTIQTVYDQYQYQLNQTANLQNPNECTVSAGRTNYVGWTLVVNSGVTLSQSGNFTEIQANTVTNNGTITAIYVSSAGTSTTWRFEDVEVGSSIIVYDASGVTKYFQQEVTTAGDYNYYIPPGTAGTYSWAIEKYGKQRQSGSFAANTGGLLFYAPIYVEDVGITETVQATVAAYTTIENAEKFYDYTAFFRLGEQGIKIGQIATRSGTSIEVQSGLSHGIRKTSSIAVYAISGGVITTKAEVYAGTTKYSAEILVPPATLTAHTNEVITIDIEDSNGNSSVNIQASGNNQFEIWKITNATNPDDYATGTLLATVGIGKYRFIAAPGFKMVIRDTTTNFRVVSPMDKGNYEAALFFGAAVQLAQAPEVTQINTKVDIMQNAINALPETIMDTTVETGATVVESLRLHNAVLGGIVSGGGTGVEVFRDLANTKDRLISTNTSTGDRTSEVTDLT